ncbi:MAG: PQQ-binding-like beta-propeller repeat protein [Bacteroidetes bacterium]|nr:PQQ-binding-like beta-propeller repeat protein [Bacteroidota bacterium]
MNSRIFFVTMCIIFGTWSLRAQEEQKELFFRAARANDVKSLKEFLDKGMDVNAKNRYGVTALFFAMDKGNLAAVDLLLDHGADPNIKDTFYGDTPLGWAIYKKNIPVLTSVINHGADLKNEDLVLGAAGEGLAGVVNLMLDKGAPGAAKVLFYAIPGNDTAMFRVAFAHVTKSDSLLTQALVSATANKNTRIIALLKEAGARMPEVTATQPTGIVDTALRGTYKNNEMNKAELDTANGMLTASFDGSPAYNLRFVSDSVYLFTDIPGLSISVQRVAGTIAGITLIQPERAISYHRIREEETSHIAQPLLTEDEARAEKPANWPSFRGNRATGIADGQHPPLTWDTKTGKNLLWKTYIPGLAHASPIVWDSNIFIITAQSSDTASEYRVGLFGDVEPAADSSSHLWKIYCLDKLTGEIRWEKKAYEGVPRVKRHVKASQANSTPVTNGEYVVALFGSEGMICYDFNGREQWRKDLGVLDAGWFFNEETQWGHASSPVICGSLVIVQCDRSKDSFIAAYDLKTGNEVWKTRRDEISSWGTPVLFQGKMREELVTNASRFIRAYNPGTGEELWRLSPNSEITVGTPVFNDSLIFVTAGYPPVYPVYAIKPGGSGDISIPDSTDTGEFIKWRKKRGGTYMPTPLAYQGYLYTLANQGLLICYDAATGVIKYKETIRGGGAFSASPVAADGKIYCTSEENGVFVIRSGPEYELITVNPVGEICMSTPAITDGLVLIRGQHHLFCIGLAKLRH